MTVTVFSFWKDSSDVMSSVWKYVPAPSIPDKAYWNNDATLAINRMSSAD